MLYRAASDGRVIVVVVLWNTPLMPAGRYGSTAGLSSSLCTGKRECPPDIGGFEPRAETWPSAPTYWPALAHAVQPGALATQGATTAVPYAPAVVVLPVLYDQKLEAYWARQSGRIASCVCEGTHTGVDTGGFKSHVVVSRHLYSRSQVPVTLVGTAPKGRQ